jgi:glutathione synthase/RimK-type ligase-like ATP-grasp enzyme|tara:strand:- start:50 stop:268 length:219 start_codon:yes stop_codon:yes gene_type:complete
MKKHTNIEFTKKEAQAIAEALDIASNISHIAEEDRPSGTRYINNPEGIRNLSYKIYRSQVTGAQITMVDKDD